MRLLVALLVCVVGLSQSTLPTGMPAAPLPHDAYIWQRAWTPRVIAAAARSADLVRTWRVLLAEADSTGRWVKVAVPWPALQAAGRPTVGVIRIDGRLDEARMPVLLDRIAATLEDAPALAGLEIDFDCPTSKLPGYTRFLAALRQRLPASLKLSITALPTWMNSPALERLATDLDELVLQVHAVDDPRRGLFDPEQAERWIHAFARRIARPIRVALPAYDVRVTWHGDGRLASVEGERPLLTGASGTTLRAAPEAVLALLHRLQRAAPDTLAGIVWFRLPTDSDRRAWSPDTWRAVVTDRLPPANVGAVLVPADSPGLWTVLLANDGTLDADTPRRVHLDARCASADGANGFHLVAGTPLALESAGGRLRAQERRIIGWARCTEPRRQLDVAS